MGDEYELEGRESGELRILKDPVPEIKLVKPGTTVTSKPDGKVAFKFNVTDDLFAVKSVFLEYRRKSADGDAARQWADAPGSLRKPGHGQADSRDVRPARLPEPAAAHAAQAARGRP